MASNIAKEVDFPFLYFQIASNSSPFAILGIGTDQTEAMVREAHRQISRQIHPNKAPSDSLRGWHTSLFQKVQAAYETILRHLGHGRQSELPAAPKCIADISLQARNAASREALRDERERAVHAKHETEAKRIDR